MIEDSWERACVLCARRSPAVNTMLQAGHCCPGCHQRIRIDLAAIGADADLVAVAQPAARPGTRSVHESKPPTDLEPIAPWLALVRLNPGQDPPVSSSIAGLLADWERMLRDQRGLAPYGPATAHHVGIDEGVLAAQAGRQAIRVLLASIDWITDEPSWPLEDFADEVGRCARRMHGLAHPRGSSDRVVRCPTLTDESTCGRRLTVRTWAALDDDRTIGEPITCGSCGVTRSPEQLLRAAGKQDTWADAEALASWFGITERTLRQWAAKGLIRRERSMYAFADVEAQRDAERERAYQQLAKEIRA